MKLDVYKSVKSLKLLKMGVNRAVTVIALVVSLLSLLIVTTRQTENITHLVPPEISRAMWIGTNTASAEYLEDMAAFISSMVFDVTPVGAEMKGAKMKRYVCAAAYGEIDSLIKQGVERLRRDSASTSFSIRQFKTEPQIMRVTLEGQLNVYIGEKRVSDTQKTYLIDFQNQAGKLCVKALYEQKNPSTDASSGTTKP